MNIIKKRVGENKRSWDNQLKYALSTNKITTTDSTWKIPFELVYGMDLNLPIHLNLLVYKIMQPFSRDGEAMQEESTS